MVYSRVWFYFGFLSRLFWFSGRQSSWQPCLYITFSSAIRQTLLSEQYRMALYEYLRNVRGMFWLASSTRIDSLNIRFSLRPSKMWRDGGFQARVSYLRSVLLNSTRHRAFFPTKTQHRRRRSCSCEVKSCWCPFWRGPFFSFTSAFVMVESSRRNSTCSS